MKQSAIFIFLLLFFFPSICPAVVLDGPHTVLHEDVAHSYYLYIPPCYDGSQNVPLMLDLHGFGGNPQEQADKSGLAAIADTECFIVAYPEGYKTDTVAMRSWNAGDGGPDYDGCCGKALENGIDSAGFLLKVVEEVKSHYPIDCLRVYISGHSNGAAMSQWMAAEYPEVFSASASFSLYLLKLPPPGLSRNISVMEVHGLDDAVARYEEEPGGTMGVTVLFPGAVNNFERWAVMNGCSGAPVRVFAQGDSYCDEYQDCGGNVRIRLCSLSGTGHRDIYTNPEGIDTARMGWDFVKNTTLPTCPDSNPPVEYRTVVFAAGPNGSLQGQVSQSVPDRSDCTEVTAVPDHAYSFSGWAGDYTGTENPLVIRNITSDMQVTAQFSLKDENSPAANDENSNGGCFITTFISNLKNSGLQ